MTRYFHLLETRNCFANDGLWRGHARGVAGACGRGRGLYDDTDGGGCGVYVWLCAGDREGL